MLELNNIYNQDCIEGMKRIDDKSIDMVLCDLPYGTTACKWDVVIPFEPLWEQYKRIIKDNGAIVLTGSQPFTSALVMSNPKMFKYSWVYKKKCASNFAQAKYAPMKEHEDVLIFSNGKVNYYPIKEKRQGGGLERSRYAYSDKSRNASGEFVGNLQGTKYNKDMDSGNEEMRYPSSVQEFNNRASGDRGLHPTQKPLALFEYLIKTYTNEGDLVLDNCMGSGTTAIACRNTNRDYIGFELDKKYFDIANDRIKKHTVQPKMF